MFVKYPRVTTVIGETLPKEGLIRWQKKTGRTEVARILRETSTVGTIVHYRILRTLTNQPIPAPDINIAHCPKNIRSLCEIADIEWGTVRRDLLKIPNRGCRVEQFTQDDDLRVCGTYDLAGNIGYRGEAPKWTIADLKTSAAAQEAHFVQLGAYALFLDPYPEQGIIISVCPYQEKNPTLEPKVYRLNQAELRARSQQFIELLSEYYTQHPPKDGAKYAYSK